MRQASSDGVKMSMVQIVFVKILMQIELGFVLAGFCVAATES